MKISKIEICDFRGFPGSAVYDFEFGTSRNLFIYGENGSGKSSLFRALQEFFNRRKDAKPFEAHKNIAAPDFAGGRITVYFDDGSSQTWMNGADRPLNMPPAAQIALQIGCLDYRNLLETNFAQKGDHVNLFEIAVHHLVPHLEVPVGGKSKRIGALWSEVLRPSSHHQRYLGSTESALTRFNSGFQPIVQPLIEKATELLKTFPDAEVLLGAAFQPVNYHKQTRDFRNRELILSVHRGNAHVPNHHNFLNEARLSAIGLVIYLAGLLISVPATSEYPKLLVLDDVLVGIDMANRLPVLEILRTYFADWQIVLLTHDRVWYEMVQVGMQDNQPSDWQAYELWIVDGSRPLHQQRAAGYEFFLSRSRDHLKANDDRAAAVYARAAFETKVRSYCEKWGVPVKFNRDPRKIDAETFWKAAREHAQTKATTPAEKAALKPGFDAVDLAKKIVLNPLSHAVTTTVTRPEVQKAIDAVAGLKFPDKKAKGTP